MIIVVAIMTKAVTLFPSFLSSLKVTCALQMTADKSNGCNGVNCQDYLYNQISILIKDYLGRPDDCWQAQWWLKWSSNLHRDQRWPGLSRSLPLLFPGWHLPHRSTKAQGWRTENGTKMKNWFRILVIIMIMLILIIILGAIVRVDLFDPPG